jgi:hypothetical protein
VADPVKPCGFGHRPEPSEVKTPLHPNAMHHHTLYVIAVGHTDARGRPWEIYYCHCGEAFRFVPTGPPIR